MPDLFHFWFRTRLLKTVFPKGGPDKYLSSVYDDEALWSDSRCLHKCIVSSDVNHQSTLRWRWLSLPSGWTSLLLLTRRRRPSKLDFLLCCIRLSCVSTHVLTSKLSWDCGRVLYATKAEGAQELRPWMLGWRQDFGCSGFHEPEQASMIVELMLLEGFFGCWFVGTFFCRFRRFLCFCCVSCLRSSLRFMSDPNLPGIEKISCCTVPKAYLDSSYSELPSVIGGQIVRVRWTDAVFCDSTLFRFFIDRWCTTTALFRWLLQRVEESYVGSHLPPGSARTAAWGHDLPPHQGPLFRLWLHGSILRSSLLIY